MREDMDWDYIKNATCEGEEDDLRRARVGLRCGGMWRSWRKELRMRGKMRRSWRKELRMRGKMWRSWRKELRMRGEMRRSRRKKLRMQ